MRVLELLRIVRNVSKLPNFDNLDEVRQWLNELCVASWAIHSPNDAGDEVVEYLARSAGDRLLFDPLYRLLLVTVLTDRDLTPQEADRMLCPLIKQANEAGIDFRPATILQIATGVGQLVKLIRDQCA